MTATVVIGIAILAGLAAVIGGGYVLSRRHAGGIEPGEPDRLTGEVVSGLMTELRKTQAEAAHWKSAAERLQRELDGRS